MRFLVRWKETITQFAEVEAENEKEAIELMKSGKFIEGTMDSEPDRKLWETATAEQITTP